MKSWETMNKLTKINSCSGVELSSQSSDQQCSESSDTGSESNISSFSSTSSPNMPLWEEVFFHFEHMALS